MNTQRHPVPAGQELPPPLPFSSLLWLLAALGLGTGAAFLVLPTWVPGLSASLTGPEPRAFWYLSRASAFVALGLMWCSMVLGLLMTNKLARVWPGGPAAFELHQYTSLLGLVFALFHAFILLGDGYIDFTLARLLLPFASTGYQPLWVGLGQVGLYVMVLVAFSFHLRGEIGHRTWRLIHFASFAVFVLALVHGLFSGTDSGGPWARRFYVAAGGSVLFLSLYRLLSTR
jgi:predicted ferric reductase